MLVCVAETPAAFVGFDDLAQGVGVHRFTLARQVSCDPKPPQLAVRQQPDFVRQFSQVNALLVNTAPGQSRMKRFSVASGPVMLAARRAS
jgi:hypothetical protein